MNVAERNQLKLRKCEKCNQPIVTTAQGIKDHAQDCAGLDEAQGGKQ